MRIVILAFAMMGFLKLADAADNHRHTEDCPTCVQSSTSRRRNIEAATLSTTVRATAECFTIADPEIEISVDFDEHDAILAEAVVCPVRVVSFRDLGRAPPLVQLWTSRQLPYHDGRAPPLFT
jgi:hypothetical protein